MEAPTLAGCRLTESGRADAGPEADWYRSAEVRRRY